MQELQTAVAETLSITNADQGLLILGITLGGLDLIWAASLEN